MRGASGHLIEATEAHDSAGNKAREVLRGLQREWPLRPQRIAEVCGVQWNRETGVNRMSAYPNRRHSVGAWITPHAADEFAGFAGFLGCMTCCAGLVAAAAKPDAVYLALLEARSFVFAFVLGLLP